MSLSRHSANCRRASPTNRRSHRKSIDTPSSRRIAASRSHAKAELNPTSIHIRSRIRDCGDVAPGIASPDVISYQGTRAKKAAQGGRHLWRESFSPTATRANSLRHMVQMEPMLHVLDAIPRRLDTSLLDSEIPKKVEATPTPDYVKILSNLNITSAPSVLEAFGIALPETAAAERTSCPLRHH